MVVLVLRSVLAGRYIVILIRMRRRGKIRRAEHGVHDPLSRHLLGHRWRWRGQLRRSTGLLVLQSLRHGLLHHRGRQLLLLGLKRLLLLLLGLRLLFLVADPAPFLLQFFMQKPHAPSGFLADLVEDGQDFFLFAAGDEAFAGNGEGAEGDGGDAAVFDVGDDAA